MQKTDWNKLDPIVKVSAALRAYQQSYNDLAAAIGVTRQAVHQWVARDAILPPLQAHRIAKLRPELVK